MLQRPRQARLGKGLLYGCKLVAYGSVGRLSEYIHGHSLATVPWMPQVLKITMTVTTMTRLSLCHNWAAINGLDPQVMVPGHGMTCE